MNGQEKNRKYGMVGRVVVRRIGTDTLLVPVSGPAAGGRVFPVNETAVCIWECLSRGGTPVEAAAHVARQFEVEEKIALADAVECAQTFQSERLIEESL